VGGVVVWGRGRRVGWGRGRREGCAIARPGLHMFCVWAGYPAHAADASTRAIHGDIPGSSRSLLSGFERTALMTVTITGSVLALA